MPNINRMVGRGRKAHCFHHYYNISYRHLPGHAVAVWMHGLEVYANFGVFDIEYLSVQFVAGVAVFSLGDEFVLHPSALFIFP